MAEMSRGSADPPGGVTSGLLGRTHAPGPPRDGGAPTSLRSPGGGGGWAGSAVGGALRLLSVLPRHGGSRGRSSCERSDAGGYGAEGVLLAALLLAAACSSLGGDGGGDSNLPNRGIAAYAPVERGEEAGGRVLVAAQGEALEAPSAVAQGPGVALYVTRRPAAAGERAFIARAVSEDGGITFGALEPALTPAEVPWVRGGVEGASLVEVDGVWRMAFASDDPPGIGWATSADGARFEPLEAPLLTPQEPWEQGGVSAPSVVLEGGRFALYYTARDASGRAVIARALVGTEGEVRREGVVLEGGAACVDLEGAEAPCWDMDGVEGAEVRLARSGTGRTVYRMFYLGRQGRAVGLGFAASSDGLTWSRYRYNPTLEGAGEASNLLHSERYLLYWATQGGVMLGINDRGQVSEVF